MEVMSVYPAYDGDKDYDYDTAQYTFPHRKRTYNEEDTAKIILRTRYMRTV